jgi:hypothetical protein
MKATLAVAAFVGLTRACSDIDWDDHWDGHQPPPPASDDEDAGVDEDAEPCPPGLYADPWCKHLARGVTPYTPRYELWADGADKQRYIYLPEGTNIDTREPNRWTFPKGTRLYKTFSQDGKKLETRVFRKTGDTASINSWKYAAYVWDDRQRSVRLADAMGEKNVLGTDHDVPSLLECSRCHTQADAMNKIDTDIVNGFGAIQLNHDGRGWTLQRLIELDRLENTGDQPDVSVESAVIPGSSVERAALGYLHANCGNCHGKVQARAGLDLSVHVGAPAPRQPANTLACKMLTRWTGKTTQDGSKIDFLVDPGEPDTSGIIGRMSVREPALAMRPNQMPPIATDHVDERGVRRVSRWIESIESCAPVTAQP